MHVYDIDMDLYEAHSPYINTNTMYNIQSGTSTCIVQHAGAAWKSFPGVSRLLAVACHGA